jgi:hypothetical protein
MFFNFMKPKKDHAEAANAIVASAIAKIAEKDTKETILVLRRLVNAAFDHIETVSKAQQAAQEPEAGQTTQPTQDAGAQDAGSQDGSAQTGQSAQEPPAQDSVVQGNGTKTETSQAKKKTTA